MSNLRRIETPLDEDVIMSMKAGDVVSINGVIYAARDAAHKKMAELIRNGQPLPFDVKGQIIYYVGPCPAAPGLVIGPAGPTTSGRMDAYTPALLELGLAGMIGKGSRSDEVVSAMLKHKAVYFAATGGAAAVIAKSIKSAEVIAFPELGPEAVRKMVVENFRATVVIDCHGNNLYVSGRAKYRRV
jgi:fumarate hydratase subunit beta